MKISCNKIIEVIYYISLSSRDTPFSLFSVEHISHDSSALVGKITLKQLIRELTTKRF